MKALSLLLSLMFSLTAFARINDRAEDGLAITHPRIVTTLMQRASGEGIGLGFYLDPTGQTLPKEAPEKLALLPSFKPVMESLQREIDLFKKENESKFNTVGVGVLFHSRLFDMNFLKDDRTTLSLIGIVNRMDQAYESPETCGEIRLIYRLAYNVQKKVVLDNKEIIKEAASRMPLMINLVLNAKSPDSKLTCAEIATRWRTLDTEGIPVRDAVDKIFGADGPLAPELRGRNLIRKLEINLQLSRTAAAVRPDFGGHAVYLLKVYDWNASTQKFEDAPLKNQVDREKYPAFFKWLSQDPERVRQLDDGTILIPREFLAMRAYSITPGGLSRLQNHLYYGKISDKDMQALIDKLPLDSYRNIKSLEGFKRRLTDISCTGCHQSRAIGGFHFMGQDPLRWNKDLESFAPLYPGNAVVVPGSGHFFADIPRRRAIQDAMIASQSPDFSSGFSSRPSGAEVTNVWGSHCHVGGDESFKNWTCAPGNKCLVLYSGSKVANGFGVCVSDTGLQLGDPTEVGIVSPAGKNWFADVYKRTAILPIPVGNEYVNSPQSPLPKTKTGGFPGGSIRTTSCDPAVLARHPEAKCGTLPAGAEGFNDCLFDPKTTPRECHEKYSVPVGLRGCSRANPCRDDYICAETVNVGEDDSGVCVPPYFIFQFRVDGHPIKF